MASYAERVSARIAELERHQRDIRARATRDVAEAQAQIEALQRALVLLTPQAEAIIRELVTLQLVPKE